MFSTLVAEHTMRQGAGWLVKGTIKHLTIELLWLILLPVTLILHALGYRRLMVLTWRIGHLAAEMDSFFKERSLGRLKPRKWFLLAPPHRVANSHLLEYWRNHMPVISGKVSCALLGAMTRHYFMREDVSRYVANYVGTQEIYQINAAWGDRPPVLHLTQEDEHWSREALARIGIPENRWFVCIHVRENGYLAYGDEVHAHRNADIWKTIPAMSEIIRHGGICVRVGDPSMTPLPDMKDVIDYARHPDKSERLDVILCAKAKFFLGCTSGLAFVSTTFGVPCAHANMIPVATLGLRYCDISIPKLLWSVAEQRYLHFEEILGKDVGNYFFSSQYLRAGLRVDENSSDDILDLVQEMLNRLNNRFEETEIDVMYHDTYMRLLQPGDYSFGAVSRIGIAFLRKHADLLLVHSK